MDSAGRERLMKTKKRMVQLLAILLVLMFPAMLLKRTCIYEIEGKYNLAGAEADYTICIENGHALSHSYYQRAKVYEAMGDREKQTSDLMMSLKFSD